MIKHVSLAKPYSSQYSIKEKTNKQQIKSNKSEISFGNAFEKARSYGLGFLLVGGLTLFAGVCTVTGKLIEFPKQVIKYIKK